MPALNISTLTDSSHVQRLDDVDLVIFSRKSTSVVPKKVDSSADSAHKSTGAPASAHGCRQKGLKVNEAQEALRTLSETSSIQMRLHSTAGVTPDLQDPPRRQGQIYNSFVSNMGEEIKGVSKALSGSHLSTGEATDVVPSSDFCKYCPSLTARQGINVVMDILLAVLGVHFVMKVHNHIYSIFYCP
ncbi:hypothetical protein PENSPDRAFT_672579 [Peniophora sp. CONT]|nr:hypothetical protein PENSPDRAFT_672579 [Peniophora sp. CONT]